MCPATIAISIEIIVHMGVGEYSLAEEPYEPNYEQLKSQKIDFFPK